MSNLTHGQQNYKVTHDWEIWLRRENSTFFLEYPPNIWKVSQLTLSNPKSLVRLVMFGPFANGTRWMFRRDSNTLTTWAATVKFSQFGRASFMNFTRALDSKVNDAYNVGLVCYCIQLGTQYWYNKIQVILFNTYLILLVRVRT